jgi:Flp pilus assembly pilin Flp
MARNASDRGATAVEYALLCTLLVLPVGFGATKLAGAISSRVAHQSDQVAVVVTPSP